MTTHEEILAVECPTCRALPGWECLNRITECDRDQPHLRRIRAATIAAQQVKP